MLCFVAYLVQIKLLTRGGCVHTLLHPIPFLPSSHTTCYLYPHFPALSLPFRITYVLVTCFCVLYCTDKTDVDKKLAEKNGTSRIKYIGIHSKHLGMYWTFHLRRQGWLLEIIMHYGRGWIDILTVQYRVLVTLVLCCKRIGCCTRVNL